MFQAKATATSGVNNMYVSRLCLRGKHIRDGQNNGNIRQYRNQTVCVGYTERTSVVSTFRYCFVCLRCVVPVSMHYILCLATVRMEVLQNGRLVKFSKQTHCW